MGGVASEYTMGNWAGTVGSSGFTTSDLPGGNNGSKYYDKYTGTSSSTPTSNNAIKGDATYETMRWYSDGVRFLYASYPWSSRGVDSFAAATTGVFSSNASNGTTNSHLYSFRAVLIP